MISIDEIKTERLVLRKFVKTDLDSFIEWNAQKSYFDFISGDVKSKEESKNILYNYINSYGQQNQTLIWAIVLKENGQMIGSLNISKLSTRNKCCEIGWGLNLNYQKHGYALEASKAFINYIFDNLNMNKIAVSIWDENISSIKLAELLGFKLEGRERECRIKESKIYDVLHYGLLKREFNI